MGPLGGGDAERLRALPACRLRLPDAARRVAWLLPVVAVFTGPAALLAPGGRARRGGRAAGARLERGLARRGARHVPRPERPGPRGASTRRARAPGRRVRGDTRQPGDRAAPGARHAAGPRGPPARLRRVGRHGGARPSRPSAGSAGWSRRSCCARSSGPRPWNRPGARGEAPDASRRRSRRRRSSRWPGLPLPRRVARARGRHARHRGRRTCRAARAERRGQVDAAASPRRPASGAPPLPPYP